MNFGGLFKVLVNFLGVMRNFWGLSTKFFSKNLFQIFYIVQLYIVVGVSNGRDSPTNRDLDETNMKLTCNQAYSN